jgi:hypothetical protein
MLKHQRNVRGNNRQKSGATLPQQNEQVPQQLHGQTLQQQCGGFYVRNPNNPSEHDAINQRDHNPNNRHEVSIH